MNRLLLTCLLVGMTACSGGEKVDDTGNPADSGDSADTGDTGSTLDAVCTEAVEPTCIDDMILDLSLQDNKTSDGEVVTTVDGADFVTTVDASAGGSDNADRNAWTYVSFGVDGATRIDLDDETALENMDWDLALKRYIIRVNSGDSGPSCVGVDTESRMTYEEITAVPDGATYLQDDFYTDACAYQEDNSGLPSSPDVAMHDWWEYPRRCVEMTMTPFVVQKADGHIFKIVVESYYGEDQADCADDGQSTALGGYFILRWKMLN